MARNQGNPNNPDARLDSAVQRAAPQGRPPADLLARCLKTAPPAGVTPEVAAWLSQDQAPRKLNGHSHPNGHSEGEHEPATLPFASWQRWTLPAAAAAALLVAAIGLAVVNRPTDIARPNPDPPKNNIPVVVEHKQTPQPEIRPEKQTPSQVVNNNTPRPPMPELNPRVPQPLPEEERSPPRTPRQMFDAQLASGEFAGALQTAKKIDKLELRDEWLGQLALVQAANGQTGAALDTVRQMGTDTGRANVLGRIPDAVANGGGAQADFDSLIDLITSTVAPQSWDEVGGRGSIQPFPTGVYIDPQGVLQREMKVDPWNELRNLHATAPKAGDNRDVRRDSPLRKVSLTRLEREAQMRRAMGLPVDEDMRFMAGLERIEYVLVYPNKDGSLGDIVLAGPAGDWQPTREGRVVRTKTGRPVVQLDDLVVLLRHLHSNPNAPFGCLIAPRTKNLADFKADNVANASKMLDGTKEARDKRLEELRTLLGRQDIEVYGNLDPRTRVARVLVEADYRMKLVGIGLEEGTLDVPSCLELFKKKVAAGENLPGLDVLRLWFTLNYQAILASPERTAFNLRGPGVQVLSENQFLTDHGERLPTGKSDVLYQEFAANFSQHFAGLAARHPVYADLQNVCDLAMVSALIQTHGLADQIGWRQTFFGTPRAEDALAHEVALGPAPKEVDSVANYVEVSKKQVVFVVSGGVRVNPWNFAKSEAVHTDKQGGLLNHYRSAAPGYQEMPTDAWWWD